MSGPDAAPAQAGEFWQEALPALTARLGVADTIATAGLSTADAAGRLARFGPNVLRPRHSRALALQFLARFLNPLVLLLLAAATISAFVGDRTSFTIIVAMVVLSVTLDFVQETRAGHAAEALKRTVALRARVVRDGAACEVPTDQLVPGDVLVLGPGSLVPADARVLTSRDLFVNQALLTGESYPVEKRAADTPEASAAPGAASDAVFMGTSIVSGTATALVCRTGRATALGDISASLALRPPATAFELGVKSFGFLILQCAVALVLFVVLVNAAFARPWLESFLFAVALAVGLTPELLPMVVTVTLSRGAIRMAKERVIVKRLSAVHDLGSMDVLCTDKTGTLTEATIRLEQHLDPQGNDSARVLGLAVLNSALETGLKTPMDEAILRHADVDIARWKKIDEVPFDFERRCVSVLADDGARRVLVLKGAFEDVLAHSTRYETGGVAAGAGAAPAPTSAPPAAAPIDDAVRAALRARFDALAAKGFRVLGLGWRETPRDQAEAKLGDEADLVFAGFACFEDPPKPSAAAAVRALEDSGVTVKIVTGDNEIVTRHLWAQLGLPEASVLTGAEMAQLSDAALLARVETVGIFARVTPPQKNRVIQALRRRGHVVGYLGDGINDAPSLHSADVGLSVQGAVDVAREAADMILLDQDLGVVHKGVLEGRRTFGNILKYIRMGTSSNFGNMFSMAGGTLVLPFLPMLPVQILVNNFLYDLSQVPLPLDRVDPAELVRPRRWNTAEIRNFMLVVGPVSSLFDFGTFWVMRHVFHAREALFHTGWFVESLATQVLVIFVIRTSGNPFRSRPSGVLVATALAAVGVAVALPWTPLGARLGLVPLPPGFFGILAAMVVVYLIAVEVVKRVYFARTVKPSPPAA
jgi:Mg2+-importing ATPase